MNASTIRVPAPFARALLDDWRVPPEDDERDSITDPEQIRLDAELDAWQARWIAELDGKGDRIIVVPTTGPFATWLHEELTGSVLDGLTGQLWDGSARERRAIVEALDGWVKVMALLDEAKTYTSP
jgi:hypothetical protein